MPSLQTHDPLRDTLASRDYINYKRDTLEQSPVVIDGNAWDCDEKSQQRMSRVIEMWDSLGIDAIEWTLADNSKLVVTKQQLTEVYNAIVLQQAKRAMYLHQLANQLKQQAGLSMRDVENAPWNG